jgi:glycosyltransferase involved in cell wall biosynthesis
MPVYNAEKYVGHAIDSILNQTLSNFELFIADDGSTDGSKMIIDDFASRDARVICDHNFSNLGKTATVNRLFRHCHGEYVTIHDSDDWSHYDRFRLQISFLKENNDHVLCGTNFVTLLENDEEFDRSNLNISFDDIMFDAKNKSQIHGPTAIFRREPALKLSSIYRPYFQDNCEDVDFIYRLFSFGKGMNIPQHLYYYRILPDSLCRKEFTERNRSLYKIAYHLLQQRITEGTDDIERSLIRKVDDYLNEITLVYRHDSSKIHREAAAYFLYWGFRRKAIKAAFLSINANPLKIINYRTALYCFRKVLFQ